VKSELTAEDVVDMMVILDSVERGFDVSCVDEESYQALC
jgi:hypothetical protein